MNIIDITRRFEDNSLNSKVDKTIVYHWTGGLTAASAINWLDQRKGGKGSVGYNYIIGKDGRIFMLANPHTRFMHNTGKGTNFDKRTISISLASNGENDPFTDKQIKACRDLRKHLQERFSIIREYCHRELNKKKPDFPDYIWEDFKKKVF